MCCDLFDQQKVGLSTSPSWLIIYFLYFCPFPDPVESLHNKVFTYHSHFAVITAFHIQWLAVHGKICCVWLRMHVLRVGERVHFDAQFKVGWHYLFMPLLFLFPLRVKNSWRSILGRSRLTQTESIASQLNETHLCAHTFRRCSLSIHLPSWSLFVGPSCLRPPPPLLLNFQLFAVGLT